jgi:hypothetical protein
VLEGYFPITAFSPKLPRNQVARAKKVAAFELAEVAQAFHVKAPALGPPTAIVAAPQCWRTFAPSPCADADGREVHSAIKGELLGNTPKLSKTIRSAKARRFVR